MGFLWGLRVWVKGWVVLWWLCAFALVWIKFSSSFLGCGYNGYLFMVVGMRLVFMVIGADLVRFLNLGCRHFSSGSKILSGHWG